jgi:ABC-2 type transport system permease protein
MDRVVERMPVGIGAFLRGVLSFIWLEYKALLFYPANFFMTIVQSSINLGIWLFISQFISGYADRYVSGYGGSYVAYTIIGVAFHETARTALSSPFSSISTAFWDKRLETYNLFPGGIWPYILGRFFWQVTYSLIVQMAVLALIVALVGVGLNSDANLLLAGAVYISFILSVFGLGLLGGGTFFLLEVKQGNEPVGWFVDYSVRLTSGLYYPISIIPAIIRPVSYMLPHTYAFRAIRLILLQGEGLENSTVRTDVSILAIYSLISLFVGYIFLKVGIRRAESESGLGIVV